MKTKILVVAYDAGGANLLASFIKKYRHEFTWVTCTAGPAQAIFVKNRIDKYAKPMSVKTIDAAEVVVSQQPDFIFTGTGWASDFEMNFLGAARVQKIKSAAVLDHWCYYRERFGYPGAWKRKLPELVFVCDKWAYQLALRNGFPKKILRQVENPYFEALLKEKKAILPSGKTLKIKLLILSEPIYDHALKSYQDPYYWGYTEYEIVKDVLGITSLNSDYEVKLRLHPAEKKDKYADLIDGKAKISLSNKNSIVKDCLWSDIVVGSGTMALVIGLILGKKVISYMPSAKLSCLLPQQEILKIKSYNNLKQTLAEFKKGQKPKNRDLKLAFGQEFLRCLKKENICL